MTLSVLFKLLILAAYCCICIWFAVASPPLGNYHHVGVSTSDHFLVE